ncbi:MAG: glycosyltransferase family 4 protein [Saccharofermentanales bacterium]
MERSEEKRIWIWNHYATRMFENQGGRHFYFAKYLIGHGYKPTIFCADTLHGTDKKIDDGDGLHSSSSIDGIDFVFVKTSTYRDNGIGRIRNMFSFYRNVKRVAKKMIKENGTPNVILASSVHPLTLVAGQQTARRYGIPCICEIRDLWPESLVCFGFLRPESMLTKYLYYRERKIYEQADSLIFTIKGGSDYIIEKGWDIGSGGRIDLSKVYNINNGVDLAAFDVNAEEQSDESYVQYFSGENTNLIYAGSIRKVNNLELILHPVSQLIEEGVRLNFVVVGDGDERQMLAEKYAYLNDQIHFVGRIHKSHVPSILHKADICVLHSTLNSLKRFGISQNKLFDYLAAGKPIFSTIISNYDIIEEYRCGLVTQNQSVESIKDGLRSIIGMKGEELDDMRKAARKAAEEYDFQILTDKLVRIVEGLL